MNGKISVVINTLNEEKNIQKAIESVRWADEILVCDMYSDDNTAVVAKKLGAVVILHKRVGYVEPARNFAISKTSNEWVLVLDADEEIPGSLADSLQEMIQKPNVTTFIEIPRKNIIFGKWMKASMWWPDYNVRFFKKGSVEWSNYIHKKPKTSGQGIKLPADEKWAIVHSNYQSISEFINRMDRYTNIQAKEISQTGYKFSWQDLLSKPLSEFLSRFFAHRGFEDGLHGFALSLLQAFSFLVVYLKLWEYEKFNEQNIPLGEFFQESKKAGGEINYWFKYGNLSKNPLARFLQRARNKIS